MIITDGTHIVSTESLEELHQWAQKTGIGRHWFHGLRKGHPHYDIPKGKIKVVLLSLVNKEGNVEIHPSRTILEASKKIHEQQLLSRSR